MSFLKSRSERKDAWMNAYKKALQDYGNKTQAERIAWAALNAQEREKPTPPKRRFRRKKRVMKRAA